MSPGGGGEADGAQQDRHARGKGFPASQGVQEPGKEEELESRRPGVGNPRSG